MEEELLILIDKLRNQNKDVLAEVILLFGQMSVEKYSQQLWSYKTHIPFEEALKKAFKKEFTRIGINKDEHEKILESLEQYRTIQTAPHTGLHDSSRMLASHTVAMAGIPKNAYYVCATFSGIPYGNDSYPGALTFSKKYNFLQIIENDHLAKQAEKKQKDRERDLGDDGYNRLSLYPARDRNMLVYRSIKNEIYDKYLNFLNVQLKTIFENNESMTKNMVRANNKILSKIFPDQKIIVVDKNEIISNYLQIVLQDKKHFIYKMFFDEKVHEKIIQVFSTDEHFFYHSREDGKSERSEHAYIENLILKSKSINEEITPELLIDKLKNSKLCPGIFVGFTIFAFLNGFQCFGGFKQVGYLSRYKEKWIRSGLLPDYIKTIKTNSLTTGGIPNEIIQNITPLDILLGSHWNADTKIPFGKYILSIKKVLLAFKN